MTSISANISVGWPIPTGLKVDIRREGAGQIATFSWDNVASAYISSLDPSNNGGFNTVYWRVSIGSETYLVYNNPTFEMSVPVSSGGNFDDNTPVRICPNQTCVKVQTIYDISPNLATSDWCPEVCINNLPDLYCQTVKNTTVTQNYGSINMRYARAVRMGKFGSSRGSAAFKFL